MKCTLLAPLLLTFALSASAAVRRPGDQLARYRTEVLELGARLSTLEKELGAKNNLYVSSLELIRQFEGDIKLYRDELSKKREEVRTAQEENRRILQSYLLQSVNETTEPWQRKVHLELLRRAQEKLRQSETELSGYDAKVAEFDQKLLDLRRNEEELASVIAELEARKKVVMASYLSRVERKKQAESQVQSTKLASRIAAVKKELSGAPVVQSKPDRIFSRPVDDYMSFTPSPKGVTFKYSATQPVKAVGGGKIVFAGDLAAYGQVVLIDHGNDLRTVLLGRMDIRVKKDDTVGSGDVLAYTRNDTREPQNLYFEVRKKNTAQNTILWLDQKGVSKI